MSKKDDSFAKMDSQINKTWGAEVDKLRAKSEQMGAEACAKFAERLKAMRATRDAAFKKLEELHGSSESAWRNLEAGVDTALGVDEERRGEGFRQIQELASASRRSLTATPLVQAQGGFCGIARGEKGRGTPQGPH
jgi:hypothetical protein